MSKYQQQLKNETENRQKDMPNTIRKNENESAIRQKNISELDKKIIKEISYQIYIEDVLRCLKYEIKKLKSTPVQEQNVVPAQVEESTGVDLSSVESDIGFLKYDVKRLKERPVVKKFHQQQLKATPVDRPDGEGNERGHTGNGYAKI